jgi:hypothetical protein
VNYELGLRFLSSAPGEVIALRFWKDTNETGTHTGRLWTASGGLLASVVFAGETASGWQEQALAAPVAISADTEYVVTVNTGGTFYVVTGGRTLPASRQREPEERPRGKRRLRSRGPVPHLELPLLKSTFAWCIIRFGS